MGKLNLFSHEKSNTIFLNFQSGQFCQSDILHQKCWFFSILCRIRSINSSTTLRSKLGQSQSNFFKYHHLTLHQTLIWRSFSVSSSFNWANMASWFWFRSSANIICYSFSVWPVHGHRVSSSRTDVLTLPKSSSHPWGQNLPSLFWSLVDTKLRKEKEPPSLEKILQLLLFSFFD